MSRNLPRVTSYVRGRPIDHTTGCFQQRMALNRNRPHAVRLGPSASMLLAIVISFSAVVGSPPVIENKLSSRGLSRGAEAPGEHRVGIAHMNGFPCRACVFTVDRTAHVHVEASGVTADGVCGRCLLCGTQRWQIARWRQCYIRANQR